MSIDDLAQEEENRKLNIKYKITLRSNAGRMLGRWITKYEPDWHSDHMISFEYKGKTIDVRGGIIVVEEQ